MPVLAGRGDETILPVEVRSSRCYSEHGFELVEGHGWLAGVAVAEVPAGGIGDAAFDVYRTLIDRFGPGRRFYRVWNYLPHINRMVGGQENYRAFNVGRARAFEEADAIPDAQKLPAASAVGIDDEKLCVIFLAGKWGVDYFENPAQVPAYRYPPAYGPRPPSFCRGAVVGEQGISFLSGTASIRGHATVGAGDVVRQAGVTADNVELMAATMGTGAPRQFKCYLRHGERDLEAVRAVLEPGLGEGVTTYLKADICRRDLLLEVEGVYS